MTEQQDTIKPGRLLSLAAMFAAVLLAYLGLLYDTQVVHHEEYLTQAASSIPRSETVQASRGIITDRNGRTMISNSFAYDMTFDMSLLKAGQEPNAAILRLLRLCASQDRTWEDTLPISAQAPYSFTVDNASQSQKRRFLTYLSSLKESKKLLGDYILSHPELVDMVIEEEEEPEEAPPLTWRDRLRRLLGRGRSSSSSAPSLDGSSFLSDLSPALLSGQFLRSAGITPDALMDWMARDMSLPETFSAAERRLVLGVRYELACRKLGDNSAYILTGNVDTAFISLLNDGNYAGARIVHSSVRQYETACAAHILGTVGSLTPEDLKKEIYKDYPLDAAVGHGGVEEAFEPWLRGQSGRRVVSVNEDGKITGEYYSREPQPGSTVELTIDLAFQQQVEGFLRDAVVDMDNRDGRDDRGAAAAVVRVGTGEVLSLASYPTYDLSNYRQHFSELEADPATPMFNRATYGTYPPGSTLKPLTAVAALESGVVTLSEKIRDTGWWAYPNDPTGSGTYCWLRRGHGPLNVTQAITDSCNYYFAEMGYRMGLDTLNRYLTQFGLGESTGLEIGERIGLKPENPEGYDLAPWAAYGQANQLYTPIQLANYIATLVSGGEHCPAHLLKAVKSYDGARLLETGDTEPVNTVTISEENLQAIKLGMRNLVTTTLNPYFKDCVVDAGAKTGTAQLGEGITNNGVFVCFAPYDDPEIAIALVLEKGGAGSALAETAVNILNAWYGQDDTAALATGENQWLP